MLDIERKTPDFRNADNDGLGPLKMAVIGTVYAREVSQDRAVEEPDFVPTRHELLGLAGYYSKVRCNLVHKAYLGGGADLADLDRIEFAGRRIERIRKILGEKVVDEEIDREWVLEYKGYCQAEGIDITEDGIREFRKLRALLFRIDQEGLKAYVAATRRRAQGNSRSRRQA